MHGCNHILHYIGIADRAGLKVGTYRYYDKARDALDIAGLLGDLSSIPDESNVLLHVCAHNPTGLDPTPAQWGEIMRVVKAKRHTPVFDCAYQVSECSRECYCLSK